MPRDLPLGNGSLLVNFDQTYALRDIYWPHTGQALHTGGDISHTGIWIDGQFAWLESTEWERELRYDDETLVSHVTLTHPRLRVQLTFNDAVDFYRPIFLRHVRILNLAETTREVRLFFHYDWYIWNEMDGNTVFYHPELQALVAYKARAYFLANGQVRVGMQTQAGISSWATGIKKFRGAEGTWRDAEDGVLGRNPIAQGSVDGTLAFHISELDGYANADVYHWLAVGNDLPAVMELNTLLMEREPYAFLQRTHSYWHTWVNKDQVDFADLTASLIALYKRSLLIIRTQIDNAGAILAANDADTRLFSRDSYSYMWPRDGALVAYALSLAGYADINQKFFEFCNAVLTPGGYILHKYNADRSWGSSWHPWIADNGQAQLPIQEDETALILYSMWHYYERFHAIESIAPHFRSLIVPAADFLLRYRDETMHLPRASYDLWEERRGILSYTTATVFAGLQAAARFCQLFGEGELEETYGVAAQQIQKAALEYLWDEQLGRFLRMITVAPDGTLQKDATLDSSLCGLFQFNLIAADDPRMVSTMQQLEQGLWVKTTVGGMARYENDSYHQVTTDLACAKGNPWFICTLWLAQYRIASAHTLDELHKALPLLQWIEGHTLGSGVMAEQVHPFTREPLSVSPLTWSHAEFVVTIRHYVERYQQLQLHA